MPICHRKRIIETQGTTSGFTMNTSVRISVGLLTVLAIAIPATTAADSVQGRQGGMMHGQGTAEAQKQNRYQYRHQNRYGDNGSYRSGNASGQWSRGTSGSSSYGQGTSGGSGYSPSRGYSGKQGNAQGSVGNRGGGQGGGRGR